MSDKETKPSDLLLDLSTIHERPKIRIDGDLYEMLTSDDFGIVDIADFKAVGKAADKLQSGDLDRPEAEKLAKLVDEMIEKIVLDIPAEVLGKLTFTQKMKIIEVFSDAVTGEKEETGTDEKSTGENTSPASNDSTAATPIAG